MLRRLNFSVIKIFSIMIICFGSILIVFTKNIDSNYRCVLYLPIAYLIVASIIYFIINKVKVHTTGYVYMFANFIIFYRYVILPLIIIYNQYVGGWTSEGYYGFGVEPSRSAINYAVFLMVVELIFAFLALLAGNLFIANKIKSSKWKTKSSSCNYEFLTNKNLIFVYILLAVLILAVLQPDLLKCSQFLVLNSDYNDSDVSIKKSFIKVIFDTMRTCLLLLCYTFCYKKYIKKQSNYYVFLAFIALVIYIGCAVGISRWSILFPCLASLILFKDMFPKIPKSLIIVALVFAVIAILSISFYKFSYLIKNSNNPIIDMIMLVLRQSSDYFSGPRAVAQGVETINLYGSKFTLSTFFNSIFAGFAGLASFIAPLDKINVYYNLYCLNIANDHPLIMPMITEGYAFFPHFPWIFTAIFEFLVCIFDFKGKNSDIIENRYIYLYVGFYFAMCMGLNTKILFSQISVILIPCMLLFFANRRILGAGSKKPLHTLT